jgi:hypothetical protein
VLLGPVLLGPVLLGPVDDGRSADPVPVPRPVDQEDTVIRAMLAVALASVALTAPVAHAAEFVPGAGTASSDVVTVTLRSAGLSFGLGVGKVRARFVGVQGSAEAAGADVSRFDGLARSPLVCGKSVADLFPAGTMPGRVVVSSGEGATTRHEAAAGVGSPVEVMSQTGSARPGAAAAEVGGVRFAIPGVLTVIGGAARSTADLVPASSRAAAAASSLSSVELLNGLVRLDGLRWTASDISGKDPARAAGFSVAAITVGGTSLPGSDPASFDAANRALQPFGLSLHAPTVGAAVVTPLRLTVTATPALRAVLAAALEGIQPIRTGLLTFAEPLAAGPDCGLATALGFGYLVADLATVFLGEEGGIDLDLGGAQAGTDATTYANPFGADGQPLVPAGTAVQPLTTAPAAGALLGLPGSSVAGSGTASTVAGSTVAVRTAAPRGTALLEPVVSVCRSAHLNGGGCARRGGVLAGVLAVALIVLLAAADRVRALVRRS